MSRIKSLLGHSQLKAIHCSEFCILCVQETTLKLFVRTL